MVNRINVSYGGKIKSMRKTTISEIREFDALLTIGAQQNMAFFEDDDEPFLLNQDKWISWNYDVMKIPSP